MTSLSPYLVVILCGFLPNEVFRVLGVIIGRRIDENREFLAWIRIVATTLLAAVVSKLVYAPAAALATVPISIRIAAVAIGIAAFFATRRSLLLGILIGEAAFVAGAFWSAR